MPSNQRMYGRTQLRPQVGRFLQRAEAERHAAEAAFWSQGVASEAPEPPPSVTYIGGGKKKADTP